jgi:curli biogenesis system outer membrane secretion channel CsgG
VDHVIDLAKNGMSESFIIKDIQKSNKPAGLTPADMGRLKKAGISETVIAIMDDPTSGSSAVPASATAVAAPAAPPASVPDPVVAAPVPVVATMTPAAEAIPVRAQKKRVVVDPFDYSAVMTSVQSVFGTQQNIGKGIQAMLVTRIHQGDKLVIVDRSKLKEIHVEQDNNLSNRNARGAGPQVGGDRGADAILAGDIVVYGRDDKKKGGAAAAFGKACPWCAVSSALKKEEDKFVISINYRLIDAETTEVIATGEARGESKRTSTNWAAIGTALGTGAGGAVDMTSSNFAATIIGEATQDCVNKLTEILNKQASEMKRTVRDVEASVVDVSGSTLMIGAGSGDGVNAGEVFEILHVDREVKDPLTKEVLDRVTTKVGELSISSVRPKVASGTYTGSPVSVQGFIARKKLPPQQ